MSSGRAAATSRPEGRNNLSRPCFPRSAPLAHCFPNAGVRRWQAPFVQRALPVHSNAAVPSPPDHVASRLHRMCVVLFARTARHPIQVPFSLVRRSRHDPSMRRSTVQAVVAELHKLSLKLAYRCLSVLPHSKVTQPFYRINRTVALTYHASELRNGESSYDRLTQRGPQQSVSPGTRHEACIVAAGLRSSRFVSPAQVERRHIGCFSRPCQAAAPSHAIHRRRCCAMIRTNSVDIALAMRTSARWSRAQSDRPAAVNDD